MIWEIERELHWQHSDTCLASGINIGKENAWISPLCKLKTLRKSGLKFLIYCRKRFSSTQKASAFKTYQGQTKTFGFSQRLLEKLFWRQTVTNYLHLEAQILSRNESRKCFPMSRIKLWLLMICHIITTRGNTVLHTKLSDESFNKKDSCKSPCLIAHLILIVSQQRRSWNLRDKCSNNCKWKEQIAKKVHNKVYNKRPLKIVAILDPRKICHRNAEWQS